LRQEDLLARFASEDFAVLVHGTDLAGGFTLAERLRRLVAEHPFVSVRKAGFRQTLSIGLAGFPEDGIDSGPKLLNAASSAMAFAKKRGQNRVVKHEPR